MLTSIPCVIQTLLCLSPMASMWQRYPNDWGTPPRQPQQKHISMQSDLQMKRQRKSCRTCSNPFQKSRKIYNKTPIRHQNGFSPQKSHIQANKKSLRNIDFSCFSSYAPDRNRTCGLTVRSRTLYPLSYGCLCMGLWQPQPLFLFYLLPERMSNPSLRQNITVQYLL